MANPTLESLTDPYHAQLVWVPPAWHGGICDICHNAPNPGFPTCYSCDQVVSRVSQPVTRVLPVSLCPAGSQLYHVLRSYKNTAPQLTARVAALVGRFYQHHELCLLNGAPGFDALTVVPSTTGRPGEHPLAGALKMLRPLGHRYEQLLLPGPESCSHNDPSDRAFTPTAEVAGRTVLLVDDLYTSGARLHSAASALSLAGAHVPSALVAGRFLRPKHDERAAALLEHARQQPFDWRLCCCCQPPF